MFSNNSVQLVTQRNSFVDTTVCLSAFVLRKVAQARTILNLFSNKMCWVETAPAVFAYWLTNEVQFFFWGTDDSTVNRISISNQKNQMFRFNRILKPKLLQIFLKSWVNSLSRTKNFLSQATSYVRLLHGLQLKTELSCKSQKIDRLLVWMSEVQKILHDGN